MKKLLLALLVVFLLPAFGFCEEHGVTVTWEYAEPPSDLAGYRVYLNDLEIGDVVVPGLSWSGTLELDDKDNTFAVTAYDEGGQESPKSEPSYYDPPPGKQPVITVIVVGGD